MLSFGISVCLKNSGYAWFDFTGGLQLDTEPDLVDKLLLEKSLNMIQYVKAGIVPVEESPWFDKEKLQAIKDGIPLTT